MLSIRQRVIVDPAKRGRGYGGALVGLAIERAWSLGATRVALNVIGFHQLPAGDRPDVRSMALAL